MDPSEFEILAKGLAVVSKLAAGLSSRLERREDRDALAKLQVEVSGMQEELDGLRRRDSSRSVTIRGLERTIAKMQDWDSEPLRSLLSSVNGHSFVYSLKESDRGKAPAHWRCPRCFEDREESILLYGRRLPADRPMSKRELDYAYWTCAAWGLEIETSYNASPGFVSDDGEAWS